MSMVKPREMPPFVIKEHELKSEFGFFSRKRIKKLGKKGLKWSQIKAILKPRFIKAGITSCEIKLPQCWGKNYVSFCHTKRRNDCTEEDLYKVIVGCGACATALNGMNKHQEQKIIEKIIAERTESQKLIING